MEAADKITRRYTFRLPYAAYAAWAEDDEEYKSSASGGVASVLCRHFIRQGGVVYGCAVSPGEDGHLVRHIRVTEENDIARLKGSKYVRSYMKEALAQIKKDVEDGVRVLFVGTPCQVAAVASMFKDRPENITYVDLVCHGVPGQDMFSCYMSKYLHISEKEIRTLTFRDKGQLRMKVEGESGTIYTHEPLTGRRTEELYYNLFMDGFTYAEACYRCPFARPERVSDMTIGDFWGLDDRALPEHPYGVSLVLASTPEGESLMPVLMDGMHVYERTVQEALAGNEQLRHPKRKTLRIRVFRMLSKVFGLRVYYPLVADWIIRNMIKNSR